MRLAKLVILSFICLPLASYASYFGLGINSVCISGTCPATAQPVGGTETDPINSVITLANGDIFQVFGTFGASNASGGGFSTNHDFQVTYEGNPTGGLSGADTINVMLYYAFASGGSSSANFNRDVIGAFSPGVASSSTASSCVNGTLGCTGTLTPPGSFNSTSSFALSSSGGVYTFDPSFISNFGAGSAPGSYVVWGQTTSLNPPAPTPEPAGIGLGMMGVLAFAALEFKRMRKLRSA